MNWENFKAWAANKGYVAGVTSWRETKKLIKAYKSEAKNLPSENL